VIPERKKISGQSRSKSQNIKAHRQASALAHEKPEESISFPSRRLLS
jgi:hypothetical protein